MQGPSGGTKRQPKFGQWPRPLVGPLTSCLFPNEGHTLAYLLAMPIAGSCPLPATTMRGTSASTGQHREVAAGVTAPHLESSRATAGCTTCELCRRIWTRRDLLLVAGGCSTIERVESCLGVDPTAENDPSVAPMRVATATHDTVCGNEGEMSHFGLRDGRPK